MVRGAAASLAAIALLAAVCGCLADPAKPSLRLASRPATRRSYLSYRLLKGETCRDGRKHYSKLYDNYTGVVDRHGRLRFSGVFELLKTASVTKMVVKIDRCRDAISSNTCEYYATWPFAVGFCTMIMSPGMVWTSAVRSISPRMHCNPAKAGVYTINNGSIDMALVEKIAPSDAAGNAWLFDITFFDSAKELYGCFNVGMHIYRINSKTDP